MSNVFTADMVAELLAERRPGLGEAATMQVMESLLESNTIGASIETPRQFIIGAIDKAAAMFRTPVQVDPAVALDQAVRAHLAKSLGANWSDRYLGSEKTRIYRAAEAIVKQQMAPVGNKAQTFLDGLQHRMELTPAERITAARLAEQDEKAKGSAPAKAATIALPTGDAATRLNAVNRSNQIAKISLELSNAKSAAANTANTLNLRSYAESRVAVLTDKLAALGVKVT